MVDGDARLDDDVAGRSWVSYATERIEGIGTPRVEVPPAGFMADKGPGDLMWEVIETRMTPPVTGIWGDGTRVPGIIIGPLAKRGFVDHTQYDTLSILKTIEERFGLEPLSALDAQAASLKNSLR